MNMLSKPGFLEMGGSPGPKPMAFNTFQLSNDLDASIFVGVLWLDSDGFAKNDHVHLRFPGILTHASSNFYVNMKSAQKCPNMSKFTRPDVH